MVYLNFVVFWNVTQCRLVEHRRFGAICHSSIQGSSDPLRMGPISYPETSVFNQSTLRNIPEKDRIDVITSNNR